MHWGCGCVGGTAWSCHEYQGRSGAFAETQNNGYHNVEAVITNHGWLSQNITGYQANPPAWLLHHIDCSDAITVNVHNTLDWTDD